MFNGSAYKTLGLKEGASAEEIKTAYRRLAMKHHPDRGGDPEEFKKIQSAYDYLNSVGDHVQLRKRARPDNSNFNYSFFNQAEMAEIFKNLRENLSSLVIEVPEISWYETGEMRAADAPPLQSDVFRFQRSLLTSSES